MSLVFFKNEIEKNSIIQENHFLERYTYETESGRLALQLDAMYFFTFRFVLMNLLKECNLNLPKEKTTREEFIVFYNNRKRKRINLPTYKYSFVNLINELSKYSFDSDLENCKDLYIKFLEDYFYEYGDLNKIKSSMKERIEYVDSIVKHVKKLKKKSLFSRITRDFLKFKEEAFNSKYPEGYILERNDFIKFAIIDTLNSMGCIFDSNFDYSFQDTRIFIANIVYKLDLKLNEYNYRQISLRIESDRYLFYLLNDFANSLKGKESNDKIDKMLSALLSFDKTFYISGVKDER